MSTTNDNIDINPMSDEDYSRYESRVRARAARRDLAVQKCRSRILGNPNCGRYRVVDRFRNAVVLGGEPHDYSLTLSDVDAWLDD